MGMHAGQEGVPAERGGGTNQETRPKLVGSCGSVLARGENSGCKKDQERVSQETLSRIKVGSTGGGEEEGGGEERTRLLPKGPGLHVQRLSITGNP